MKEASIAAAAKKIVAEFPKRKLKICAAESCTGGLIASSIVSVPNASASFLGSAVCYCDGAKEKVLGVRAETVREFFAESPECAAEMAERAARLYGADIAVSATGFLDGNVGEGKPAELARTAFVACARLSADGSCETKAVKISFDKQATRNQNREAATLEALNLILSLL